MKRSVGWLLVSAGMALGAACGDNASPLDVGPPPDVSEPGESRLARLTATQYEASIHDLFGADVVVPGNIEPDSAVEGLLAIGASRTSISPLGVERFEAASYDIAEQVMEPGAMRDAIVSCSPAGTRDDACAREAIEALGLKVWRRPLTDDELDRLVEIAGTSGDTLGDFYDGFEFAIAGLLQSPNFLFRVELGEPHPGRPGQLRYTDYEMASRLSYFLWNTTPDDELLAAAGRGELTTADGLRAQAERLLASPRVRTATRNFFTDLYHLYELDSLVKDPTVFTHMSPEVGPSAREETLRLVDHVLFDGSGDYRDIFTTRTTFLNRKLASIYNVRAPAREGFGMTEWPDDSLRRGVLTHISMLAGNSHPVASSATLRGKFVRTVVLCGRILPPPTDLNTALPEPDADAPTLRDRIRVHLEDDFCAGCHKDMDPIGLGFENFDALGRYRTHENGALIDPSSDIDGVEFADVVELAEVVREHPDLASCLVQNAYRYATNREEVLGEEPLLEWLTEGFALRGHRVPDLFFDIVTSPGFRIAVASPDEGGGQ